MQSFFRDLKALAIFIFLMGVLYPIVKKAAERRAMRLATQTNAGQEKDTQVAVVPLSKSTTAYVFPVKGKNATDLIGYFGDKRGTDRRHDGIDISAPQGTPVVAVADGVIERIAHRGKGGKQIWQRSADGRIFFYAHLDDWAVEESDAVFAGTTIGYVGSTGNASTPHLHFEIRTAKRHPVDPLPLLFPEGIPSAP